MAGRRCDTCAPGFHGFPSCRPCDCHEAGSAPGTCDPLTGQCYCKVRGPPARPAPHPIPHLALSAEVHPLWEAGASWNTLGQPAQLQGDRQHWLDPLHVADCPAVPSHPQENVQGPRCDQCRLGTFSLDAANPKGCTRCFCFGATDRCRSSTYARREVCGQAGRDTSARVDVGHEPV